VLCCVLCVLQIIDAIYEQDPNGATLAFADMMKKQIVMPAHLMDDGEHDTINKGRNLFAVRPGSSRACTALSWQQELGVSAA